ncbi:MAG: ParA family protein [Hyphomicrobiaceae bacterium]
MGHSIAVMNTKGGVGKSTVVMALAETLSAFHRKNVLVIDSDSQTSISTMLMATENWEEAERQGRTLVDYLVGTVLPEHGTVKATWHEYVISGVSDVEEARTVNLISCHMELTLFERMVSAERRERELRAAVRGLLSEAKRLYDIVLVDCPPGLSVLTEAWLREVDYLMPPLKPDYLAVRGFGVLKRFRQTQAEQGFADIIGVVINLKDGRIASEEQWHRRLAEDPENRVFQASIPRRAYIQRAADFDPETRTYMAKYPGDAGQAMRSLAQELLDRLAGAPLLRRQAGLAGATQAARAPLKPVPSAAGAPPPAQAAAVPRRPAPVPPAAATPTSSSARRPAPAHPSEAERPIELGAAGLSIVPKPQPKQG